MRKEERKIVARNKKASHDYFILETYDCGLVLKGTEIKSIRQTKVSLQDSYCEVKKNELYAINIHIAAYEKGNIFNHQETRERKLLATRKEINRLAGKVALDGLTIIPLEIYIDHGLAKIKIGLCKGKKLYDKRDDLKEKEVKRRLERNYKN